MMTVLTQPQQYEPQSGDAWVRYVAWPGLTHLKKIVSLDGVLCPAVVEELIDEDW